MPAYSTVDAGAENKTEKDCVDSDNSEKILKITIQVIYLNLLT